MTLLRYNTAGDRNLHGDFKQMLEKFWNLGEDDNSNVVTSQWTPRVDVKEEPQRFVIQCDIPGVDPNDIEISMDKGVLTVKGERRLEARSDNERFSRTERVHGLFHRRFALPDSADPDRITATGRNGVLQIVIPKKPETTPRKIQVGTVHDA